MINEVAVFLEILVHHSSMGLHENFNWYTKYPPISFARLANAFK